MKYENQRPDLADQVKALVQSANSTKTVPHGVKTVNPGEGLQLLSSDGAEIFWDWETANSVEQRIQDGTALIDQTRATLAQTEQELQSAQDRIGRVAAGEIEKIDGHIIINGTVDLPALNVTGELSTAIVKALDVEARRGIFTEGLTAQDSVLLGTTVAEVINAGTVAARIMTSGLLQTTTETNRGVKIDNAGIRAWGEDGQQSVQINGRNNYLQGTFQTGTTGPRISMLSGPTSGVLDIWGSAPTGHGTVWYDTASNSILNHSLTLMGISDYSGNANNPALRMFPYRGTFAFQGRWARDTDPLKFIVLTNYSGLVAGQYNTIDVPYSTPFPTNNALRFPFVSIESETGADVMATIVTQTDKMIRINVINKSGSKGSGALVVKIATFNVGAS